MGFLEKTVTILIVAAFLLIIIFGDYEQSVTYFNCDDPVSLRNAPRYIIEECIKLKSTNTNVISI